MRWEWCSSPAVISWPAPGALLVSQNVLSAENKSLPLSKYSWPESQNYFMILLIKQISHPKFLFSLLILWIDDLNKSWIDTFLVLINSLTSIINFYIKVFDAEHQETVELLHQPTVPGHLNNLLLMLMIVSGIEMYLVLQ